MRPVPSLSLQHPRITIPLSEHVGDMVSFTADSGGNVPVPLARPSGDNLCRGDAKAALQMTNLSYGFDTNNANQQIVITFQSTVAGFVEIATYYDTIDSSSLPSSPGYGRYTGGSIYNNASFPQYVWAVLNGANSGNQSINDYISGYDIFRGNSQYGRFRWGWIGNNGGAPQRFPVVVGANTLYLRPGADGGQLGAGAIIDAVMIRLVRDKSQSEPRGFFPDLSFGINLGSIQAKLGSSAGCRAVYMGDSFTVGGALTAVRDQINTKYPLTGLGYSLNAGQSDTAGAGSTWASSQATATLGAVSFTATGGSDVGGQINGSPDHQWTQSQTGNITVSIPAGSTYWQVIYGRSTNSAPFTYSVDSGTATTVATSSSTAYYGQVSGTVFAGASHTLTFTKSDTSAADGLRLTYVIVATSQTGHIAMRIATSGQAPNDFWPGTNFPAWQSLIAAFAPNVWFFENQNWESGHDGLGTPGYDYSDYALALEAALPTLCDTSGALFVLTTWWNFNSGTFSWTGSMIPPNMGSARELERQFIDRAMYARLPRQVAVLDFGQYSGWWEEEALLYNAGGYASQSTAGSASGTITSFHGSTVGYSMVGGILGDIAIGAIANCNVPADSPGVTQLLARVPPAAPATPGGLLTVGAGPGQIQPNGNGSVPTTGASGSGAYSLTVAVASSSAPILGAAVRISGAQAAGAVLTDSDGNAAFALDPGAVTVSASAPGYIGQSAAHTITATGQWDGTNSAALVLILTAAGASLSPGVGQTTAYLTTRDGQGVAVADVTVTFSLVDPQASADSFDLTTFTATSDETGLLQVLLRQSSTYQARAAVGPWTTFTTGTSASFPLPAILGNYAD